MKSKSITIFVSLTVVCIALLATLLLAGTLASAWDNLLVGTVSSSLVVAILEIVDIIRDRSQYRFLVGKYQRTRICNKLDKNLGDGIYDDITQRYNEKKVKLDLELSYFGDGKYKGTAGYEEGVAAVTFILDPVNPHTGIGSYQYLSKYGTYPMPDHGTYRIQVDSQDRSRIYVYFQNSIPTGVAAGYEIWEKIP